MLARRKQIRHGHQIDANQHKHRRRNDGKSDVILWRRQATSSYSRNQYWIQIKTWKSNSGHGICGNKRDNCRKMRHIHHNCIIIRKHQIWASHTKIVQLERTDDGIPSPQNHQPNANRVAMLQERHISWKRFRQHKDTIQRQWPCHQPWIINERIQLSQSRL